MLRVTQKNSTGEARARAPEHLLSNGLEVPRRVGKKPSLEEVLVHGPRLCVGCSGVHSATKNSQLFVLFEGAITKRSTGSPL
jgi:hypothetical protein